MARDFDLNFSLLYFIRDVCTVLVVVRVSACASDYELAVHGELWNIHERAEIGAEWDPVESVSSSIWLQDMETSADPVANKGTASTTPCADKTGEEAEAQIGTEKEKGKVAT